MFEKLNIYNDENKEDLCNLFNNIKLNETKVNKTDINEISELSDLMDNLKMNNSLSNKLNNYKCKSI